MSPTLLVKDRRDKIANYSPSVLAVDDPVCVYITDMIARFGEKAFRAGDVGLAICALDIVAEVRP